MDYDAVVFFVYAIGIIVAYIVGQTTGEDEPVVAVAALVWPVLFIAGVFAALGAIGGGLVALACKTRDGSVSSESVRRLLWKYDDEIEETR